MFFDKAKIYVKGGDGGNGCVAMRREKYIPEGGPWGGDGGRGGDVVFLADEGLRTLVDFRYKRHYKADRGRHGEGKNMHGASGDDLVLRLPVGTVIRDDDSGEIIADLIQHGQQVVVARGGRGGRGNTRFATPNNKAPRMAELGEPGEERRLLLELKLIADVGLVGFPNAGKSTIISRVSAARPKIANYPFTTVAPVLGVVRVEDGRSFVMADIPGLIEGAHSGAGLGHDFLKHIERTRILVHVLDILPSDDSDPVENYHKIRRELELHSRSLVEKPEVVVLNKADLDADGLFSEDIKHRLGVQNVMVISAVSGQGVRDLLERLWALVRQSPTEPEHPAPLFVWPQEDGAVESPETVDYLDSQEDTL